MAVIVIANSSDLATRALLSALLGPLLDGKRNILGALGAPQQNGGSATYTLMTSMVK